MIEKPTQSEEANSKKTTATTVSFLDSAIVSPEKLKNIVVKIIGSGNTAKLEITMDILPYEEKDLKSTSNLRMKLAENIIANSKKTRVRFSSFPHPEGPILEIAIPLNADKIDHSRGMLPQE